MVVCIVHKCHVIGTRRVKKDEVTGGMEGAKKATKGARVKRIERITGSVQAYNTV